MYTYMIPIFILSSLEKAQVSSEEILLNEDFQNPQLTLDHCSCQEVI